MATKLQLITAMYDHTLNKLTGSAGEWQGFLRSAARNYKLAIEEQVLVHAQRPDASAVLEIEKWNTRFGRWVNRGATGIAVVDRDNPGKLRLRYYFDISDTHESRRSRPVSLWEMKPEYEADVIETLESTFGELESKDTLPEAIYSAAQNAVADNTIDEGIITGLAMIHMCERYAGARHESAILFPRDFYISADERRALFQGREIRLTRKEFDLLWYFSVNHNITLGYEKIYEQVWRDAYDEAANQTITSPVFSSAKRIWGRRWSSLPSARP